MTHHEVKVLSCETKFEMKYILKLKACMTQLIPTARTGAGRISLFIVYTNGKLGGLFCLPESELWLVLVSFGIKRDIGLDAKISI